MLSPNPSPAKEQRQRAVPVHPGRLPARAWSVERQVRFSDCDPAGMVYTPRFIDMVNGVIEDFFPGELGIDYHRVIQSDRVGLGYANVEANFFKPAMMGDRLRFTPLVETIGGASVTFCVHCARDGEEIMQCRLVMVTTSLDLHRPIAIPASLKNALMTYQDKCR